MVGSQTFTVKRGNPVPLVGAPGRSMLLILLPRDAAVRVHQGSRSAEIACFAVDQVVTGFVQNRVHLAVQVTSAGESFPYRRSPMLHRSHMRFGSAAMLDEDDAAVRFQYASDFI